MPGDQESNNRFRGICTGQSSWNRLWSRMQTTRRRPPPGPLACVSTSKPRPRFQQPISKYIVQTLRKTVRYTCCYRYMIEMVSNYDVVRKMGQGLDPPKVPMYSFVGARANFVVRIRSTPLQGTLNNQTFSKISNLAYITCCGVSHSCGFAYFVVAKLLISPSELFPLNYLVAYKLMKLRRSPHSAYQSCRPRLAHFIRVGNECIVRR